MLKLWTVSICESKRILEGEKYNNLSMENFFQMYVPVQLIRIIVGAKHLFLCGEAYFSSVGCLIIILCIFYKEWCDYDLNQVSFQNKDEAVTTHSSNWTNKIKYEWNLFK